MDIEAPPEVPRRPPDIVPLNPRDQADLGAIVAQMKQDRLEQERARAAKKALAEHATMHFACSRGTAYLKIKEHGWYPHITDDNGDPYRNLETCIADRSGFKHT